MTSQPNRPDSSRIGIFGIVYTNLSIKTIRFHLFLFALIAGGYLVNGQSTQITDYVILAGDPQCTSDCDAEIESGSTIQSGLIGSYQDVIFENSISHGGGIYSNQILELGYGVSIQDRCYVANSGLIAGAVLQTQANADFGSDILANGDISISSGSVAGTVTHPAGTTYSGPAPAGGEVIANPTFNPLPAHLPVQSFAPAGNQDIKNSGSITPGSYDHMNLRGKMTLTLDGPGDYIFHKINNWGSYNTIIFDFHNDPNGVIRILVHDDVSLGAMKVELINGGDPSRIYLETHDNTNGRAFRLGGANFGNGEFSTWVGTVYAPYESILLGSGAPVTFKGALFSRHKVVIKPNVDIIHVPFGTCNPVSFNLQVADTDTIACNQGSITLNASANAGSSAFSWSTIEGNIVSGGNTASPVVDQAGYYFVSVNQNGCSATDSILVIKDDCIDPYYPAPENGKTISATGSELGQLASNTGFQDTSQIVYQINNDSVYIEIIAIQGQYQTLLQLLQTPAYGLTNLIDNGLNTLIISGLYPIQNLPKLDSLPQYINYVRPLFPAIIKRGVALTQGDAALRAPFVRGGFDVNGEGVRIGVLSDSYNKKPGNPAQTDISNEDLPGPGNPINGNAVEVIKEYPFGGGTDEGRAMLQIIHDIAPKADLAFRTGYISAGDFAQGILELAADSCDVIVDDITYITEPFLSDGIVSQAVNTVVGQGVTYISSAGNFGDNSYGSVFNPAPAPGDIVGMAHDFGGGDIYQSVTLQPGNYLMVLQWQDSIYSIGQTSTGTNNDLDFYLTDDAGNTLFGFNRNNLGGDPLEIMPFTVKQTTQSNILVVRAAGSDAVPFKLVIFRGGLTFNEHSAGTSTIIGHPNSEGAIAVGAVRYSQTPEYGVDPPLIESFSSKGGTPVGGVVRNKPEICAPNGVNTTVNLSGGDLEGDGLPNFFGTSAAAPHVAGVAALIKSARSKFEGTGTSPSEMKSILMNSAIDMGDPGFDFETGMGLVQADLSLLTIASPNPVVYSITLLDTNKTPGVDTILVRIEGDFFTGETKILLRNDTLDGVAVNSSTIETSIPPFTGNPPITAYTDPISSSGLDGGTSGDSLFFFNSIQKQSVQVVMDDQVKYYGESIPALTYEVLVDSVPLANTGLSLADVGLDNMNISTTANSMSNVGIYLIRAVQRSLDPSNAFDAGLLDLYDWEFIDGQLSIEKMPLTISVKDTSLEYGQLISDFAFNYVYPDSLVDASDSLALYDSIFVNHVSNIANAVILVNAEARGEYLASSRVLVNADVEKQTYMASSRVLVNARPYANPNALFNGLPDTTLIVDISAESIFDYVDSPDTVTLSNAFEAAGASKEYNASSRVLVNALDLAAGRVLVNAVAADGTKYVASSRVLVNAVPIINATVGSDGEYIASGRVLVNDFPIVNGEPVNQDSSEIVLLLDETDADTNLTDTIFPFFPINMVLGNSVGQHPIVPAALYNPNFNISYELGTLTVTPASLKLKPDSVTATYGDSIVFNYETEGYRYADSAESVIAGPPRFMLLDSLGNMTSPAKVDAGNYTIVADSLDLGNSPDYNVIYEVGYLSVLPAVLSVEADSSSAIYGDAYTIPVSISGFRHDDDSANSVVSGPAYDIFDNSATPYQNPVLVVGQYSVQLRDLVLSKPGNYLVNYGSAPLVITPADLTITARDTSRPVGDPNPVFVLDFSGFKAGDDEGDIQLPLATTTASQGSPSGSYPITLNGGSASNYNLILVNGVLTVLDRNILTVVPDTIGIREGESINSFGWKLVGQLQPGDYVISGPSFTINPSSYSSAGVYDIVPSNLVVSNQAAYQINYETGKLYVNPYGWFAWPVQIGYVCVDTVSNHPSGFNWKATFYYVNYNNTPVYEPHGSFNYLTGAAHAGSTPEVFEPGTGYFDIYFNGGTLKWKLATYGLWRRFYQSQKVAYYSQKCYSYYFDELDASGNQTGEQGRSAGEASLDNDQLQFNSKPELFPNPTTGLTYLTPAEGSTLSDYSISVMDATGRVIHNTFISEEGQKAIIDLSNLSSGIYLVKVSQGENSYLFRVVKDE